MSLTLKPLFKGKQYTVYNSIGYTVTVSNYIPPYQYDMLFEWRLSPNGQQYNIIQNYSIIPTVYFTTLKPGTYHLRCSARLGKQRLYQKIPYLPKQPLHELDTKSVLFEETIQITIENIISQNPPCCIPLAGCTAPVYIIPSSKYTDDMQVRILFKLQEKQKVKDQKVKLDEPIAPTKIDFSKVRKQKFNYLSTNIQVTAWHHVQQHSPQTNNESGEIYLQLLGMVGGEIYQAKHQVLCDGKKLELKNMLSFQATELQSNIQLQVIYATELCDRPYYIVADSYFAGTQSLIQMPDLKKSSNHESILMDPYGHYYLKYSDVQDKNQEQQQAIHQKRRIMITNGAQVVSLCAGPCDFVRPYAYVPFESQQSVKQICSGIIKTLEQTPQSAQQFSNQVICISTLSGIPLRSISIGYVNQQLYTFWEQKWKEYSKQQEDNGENIAEKLKQSMSYQEIQQLPQYRPLVRLNTFVPLPNGNYLITGQAEVMLIDYPEIYTIVADSVAKSSSKQYKAIDLRVTSILTAAIVIVQADGTIVDYLYVSDILPVLMNNIEFVELYINSEKGQGSVPGFLSQSGYAVNYAFIDHVDVSNQDCFCVLPRQGTVLKIDIDNLKHQKSQVQQQDIITDKHISTLNVEEAKQDLVMYCSEGACSSLSLLSQKTIQPNMYPLSISRVGTHSFWLVNNQMCNSIDVLIVRNPQYIGRGRYMAYTKNDSIEYCTSFQDITDHAGEYELRSSMSNSGKTGKIDSPDYLVTDASESEQPDEFLLLERIIIQENIQAKSGVIFGIQHRHFVIGIQIDKQWHILEITQGHCIYAAIVNNTENLRFIKVP